MNVTLESTLFVLDGTMLKIIKMLVVAFGVLAFLKVKM